MTCRVAYSRASAIARSSAPRVLVVDFDPIDSW
jgi:hypothetical protein